MTLLWVLILRVLILQFQNSKIKCFYSTYADESICFQHHIMICKELTLLWVLILQFSKILTYSTNVLSSISRVFNFANWKSSWNEIPRKITKLNTPLKLSAFTYADESICFQHRTMKEETSFGPPFWHGASTEKAKRRKRLIAFAPKYGNKVKNFFPSNLDWLFHFSRCDKPG